MAELLRAADRANAVIDLDDLSTIYPDQGHSFARDNLKAIWPNYAAVPQLKVVIPSVLVDEQEREQLRAAVSGGEGSAVSSICTTGEPTSRASGIFRSRPTAAQ